MDDATDDGGTLAVDLATVVLSDELDFLELLSEPLGEILGGHVISDEVFTATARGLD
jgi:hypothetical protein